MPVRFDTASARAASAFDAATRAAEAAESDVRAADAALRIARLTHGRIASLHATRSATSQELDQAVASLSCRGGAVGRSDRARRRGRCGARRSAGGDAQRADQPHRTRCSRPRSTAWSPSAPPIRAPWRCRARRSLTLEDTSRLRLEVRLDESRAAQVAVGQAAQVSIDEKTLRIAGPRPASSRSHGSTPSRTDSSSKSNCRAAWPCGPVSSRARDSTDRHGAR